MTQLTSEFSSAELDIFIDQGDTFNKLVTLRDSSGQPLDITGYSISARLKQYYNTQKDYNLQAEIYGTPTSGQIRLFMSSSHSSLLTSTQYVYEVRLTGEISTVRVLSGKAIISPMA